MADERQQDCCVIVLLVQGDLIVICMYFLKNYVMFNSKYNTVSYRATRKDSRRASEHLLSSLVQKVLCVLRRFSGLSLCSQTTKGSVTEHISNI